jgi:hypothetical protein
VRHKELAALPFRPRAHWPLALVMPTSHPRLALVGPVADMIRETARELSRSGMWPSRGLHIGVGRAKPRLEGAWVSVPLAEMASPLSQWAFHMSCLQRHGSLSEGH